MRKIISTLAVIAVLVSFAVPAFAQSGTAGGTPILKIKELAKTNNLTLKGSFVYGVKNGKTFIVNPTKVSPKKASKILLNKDVEIQVNKQTKVMCKGGESASILAFLDKDKLEITAKVDAKGNLIAKKVKNVTFACAGMIGSKSNGNNSSSGYIAPLSPSEGFFGAVAKINQTAMTFDLNVSGGTYHVKATASTQIVMTGVPDATFLVIKNGDNVVIKGAYDEATNVITAERIDVSANVPLQ